MFGVTLILGIAITGGIIAFLGDRIGTRVGKRRMTLWGLRPRYTSIIITILTGILIAGSTLSVLAIISYDVRTALFGMQALKKQTRELSDEVDERTEALKVARAELEKKNAEYMATNEQIAGITRELQALQASKQALDERIASLNLSKEELQKDIDRLTELTATLRRGLATVREGTIILRAGEVVAVNVIQGGGSRADIERRIGDYLNAANQRLRDRFQIKDSQIDLIFIAKPHAEEVIKFLHEKPEPIVLRLLSAGNVVAGEPVVGQFEVFPNRQVYAQGETLLIDRIVYNGETNEAEQLLSVFLQRVNENAVKQGVIPDPLQGTVGVVSMEQYYDAVSQLRHMKGNVEVAAKTSEKIFSAGPLRIEIQVRSLSPSL